MSWNLSTGLVKGLLGKTAPFGSVAELLTDGVIELYQGNRPASSDDAATGTLLLTLTLNGDGFVAGVATNGINLGEFSGTTLKRAIDAVTTNTEIWRGTGLAAASTGTTAGYARWYANAMDKTASTTAVRMDGVVATSGGDLNMVNGTTIVSGVNSEVSDVAVDMTSV